MRDWSKATHKGYFVHLSKTDIIALDIAEVIKQKSASLNNDERCEVAMKIITLVEYATNVEFNINENGIPEAFGFYDSSCDSGAAQCNQFQAQRLVKIFDPEQAKDPEEK